MKKESKEAFKADVFPALKENNRSADIAILTNPTLNGTVHDIRKAYYDFSDNKYYYTIDNISYEQIEKDEILGWLPMKE